MAKTLAAVMLLTWLATFVPLGTGGVSNEWVQRSAHQALRHLARGVDVVASSRLASWLLGKEAWRELCDAAMLRWTQLSTRERTSGTLLAWLAVAALAGGFVARSPVGVVAVVACAVAGIPAWATTRRRRAHTELVAEMPGVFRTLAMALGSGETLSQAIEYVGVNGVGPAAHAFAHASLALRCGATVEEALGSLSAELDAPGMGLLVSALFVAQRTGSPLAGLLQRSATLVERTGEFERLLEVKTAQVRLSVRVVCLLPVVLVVGLSLMSVDFQKGLMTPVGLSCVFLAALADLFAIAIIRHIIGGVL